MPFRFSLKSLLQLRRSEERQQELVVRQKSQDVQHAEREVETIENAMRVIVTVPPASLTGAELNFDRQRLLVLDQRLAVARDRLHAAQEEYLAATTALRRLWQKREMLDALERCEREVYLGREKRREQKRQDDWFLQQRQRRQELPRD